MEGDMNVFKSIYKKKIMFLKVKTGNIVKSLQKDGHTPKWQYRSDTCGELIAPRHPSGRTTWRICYYSLSNLSLINNKNGYTCCLKIHFWWLPRCLELVNSNSIQIYWNSNSMNFTCFSLQKEDALILLK